MKHQRPHSPLNRKTVRAFLVSVLLLLGSAHTLFGENTFDVSWNLGSFGGGLDFSTGNTQFDVLARLPNIFVEHKETHLGMEFNLLTLWAHFPVYGGADEEDLYFLNASLFWNPWGTRFLIFGPFAALNYMSLYNWSAFDWDRIQFSTGLRFLLKTGPEELKIPIQLIGGEAGYRYNSGRHSFYVNINIDITILAGIFFLAASDNPAAAAAIKSNEEYEKVNNGQIPPDAWKPPEIPLDGK
jgi:hypothetical protein